MKKPNQLFRILRLYIIFLIPTFLVVGFIFTHFVANKLWYEWDSLPIIDLIESPIVHTQDGAHFILPSSTVYSIWSSFLAITFLIPLFIVGFYIFILKLKK